MGWAWRFAMDSSPSAAVCPVAQTNSMEAQQSTGSGEVEEAKPGRLSSCFKVLSWQPHC